VKRRELLASLAALLAGGCAGRTLRKANPSSSHGQVAPTRARSAAINVRDDPFSATGDGITDDTAAFVSARNAAGVNGMVIIPAGTYVLSNVPLDVVGQHWRIMRSATLLLKPATNGPIFTISGDGTVLDGAGVVDGNIYRQTPALRPCAQVSAAHVTVQGLTFRNGNGYMLSFDGRVSGGAVLDCRFSNTYMQAIVFGNSADDGDITDITITNNKIFNYGTTRSWSSGGIAVVGPSNHRARRVVINHNVVEAWPFSPGAENRLANACIELLRCDGFTVTGNTLKGSSLPVTIPYSTHGRVDSNRIEGWGWYGIEVPHTASDVTISENTLQDTDPRAPIHHSLQPISITDAATYVTVAGNTVDQSPGSVSPAMIIGEGSPGGARVNHITIARNSVHKAGARGGCVHVAGAPHVTITANLFDCGGVSNNVIWLQADGAVLVDQAVIRNKFLNYGTGSAIIFGGAYGVDYATVRENIFRAAPGASGITRTGPGNWGPHTSIADNAGP
jgi:hypothetical protein